VIFIEEIGCLFCNSLGPYNTVEHVIPESLGNKELVIKKEVCDSCQNYFGKEIENYILNKTPFGFWRVYYGIETKHGKYPSVDLSNPNTEKGILPECSPYHDNNVGFTAHDDGSTSVDIDDLEIVRDILDNKRSEFKFVLSPKHLVALGRFFGKIGIELICLDNPSTARSKLFDNIRCYVRYGIRKEIWPIFHSNMKEMQHLQCKIHQVGKVYYLLTICIGTDRWVICLNDPFPTPIIKEVFPKEDLKLIWNSSEEWRNTKPIRRN
jgi:hypothetical protein